MKKQQAYDTHRRTKNDRLAREGKKPLCLRRHTKPKKRASSRGERGTLTRHATVEKGSRSHRSPFHSSATTAPRSPLPAFLGRRALANLVFHYPYPSHPHASPVNASDRQLLILFCVPLTLAPLLASPSRQSFAYHMNTPDTDRPLTYPPPHTKRLRQSQPTSLTFSENP